MNDVTVIIPTTGAPELKKAIMSVIHQTYDDVTCYVVNDGDHNHAKTSMLLARHFYRHPKIKYCCLPINVGANGFYGHRVYAAFTNLVNTKYVLYLDQDNWFEPNHIKSCIETIEKNNLQWCHSLRNIYEGELFVAEDNCESLGIYQTFQGGNHVDTNCYCVPTEIAVKVASAWFGGWGQDRVFLHELASRFPTFEGTGQHTVNYRLAGNEGSVKKEFFLTGNEIMKQRYNGGFPWKTLKT